MTTLKLSDLAGPDAAGWSDVAVFVRADGSESEPFVVGETWPSKMVVTHFAEGESVHKPKLPVRRLGRGRLEPARIVMEGESGLAAQVRMLREALAYVNLDSIAIRYWIGMDGINAIIAATTPMTDSEALAKSQDWFGPNAVAHIGTERGGTDERYVGVETGDTIHARGTGRTWEECFANVPKLYRPEERP